MLDLLMSLPEELPLLDCKKLHKHLIQVHLAAHQPIGSECNVFYLCCILITLTLLWKKVNDGATFPIVVSPSAKLKWARPQQRKIKMFAFKSNITVYMKGSM